MSQLHIIPFKRFSLYLFLRFFAVLSQTPISQENSFCYSKNEFTFIFGRKLLQTLSSRSRPQQLNSRCRLKKLNNRSRSQQLLLAKQPLWIRTAVSLLWTITAVQLFQPRKFLAQKIFGLKISNFDKFIAKITIQRCFHGHLKFDHRTKKTILQIFPMNFCLK